MLSLFSALAFLLVTFSASANAFYPAWQAPRNLNGQLYCARAYDRAVSEIVTSPVPANTIWQITSLCKTTNGGLVNPSVCQESIITTGAAFGLAVLYWKRTNYWGSIHGPNKRSGFISSSTEATDDFLSRIPDHITISNIKVNNAVLVANTSSATHRRMKRDAQEYNVYYNGTLPLTFILHHPITTTSHIAGRASPLLHEEIPLFAATDGQNMYLTHISPSTPTPFPIPPNTLSGHKRSGFDGFNYISTGGIKLQSTSDPVAQWNDVMNWIHAPTEGNGMSPFQVMLDGVRGAGWLGHSFGGFVHDRGSGRGFNGQWGMAGEAGAFGTDWDPDWNWCWGAFPQNC